jgi:nucleotide-binding universal stress UspA family protein
MFDKIRMLVGYDESPQSKNAVKEAITIATRFSGFIKVVYVYGKGMEGKAETAVIEAQEKLNEAKVEHEVSLVLGSDPAKTLLSIAKEENIALIVVGNRGLGNTLSFLLGSVSKQIVANSHCNVLVIKGEGRI